MRFTRAGTFSYVCILHPSMQGRVVVRAAKARIPRRSADRTAARAELRKIVRAAIVKEGAVVVTAQAGSNRFIQAGNDGTGFTVAKFFPPEASVLVGVPITLRVSPRSDTDHTFTFGPPALIASLRGGLVAGKGASRFELSPQAVWPSDATLPPFTPTVHGNGFLNTGILDTGALGDSPLSLSSNATVTFSTPGSYALFCLIHPSMQAKVDVVAG
jgi:hypothetical protein